MCSQVICGSFIKKKQQKSIPIVTILSNNSIITSYNERTMKIILFL